MLQDFVRIQKSKQYSRGKKSDVEIVMEKRRKEKKKGKNGEEK